VIEMTGGCAFRAPAADRRSRTEADGFAELVYGQRGWLDAEFTAIIAANFGDDAVDAVLPPPPPHRDIPAAPRPGRRQPVPIGQAPPTEPSAMARRVGACERSPPRRASADRR
jgi:hypothetical protein